MEEFPKIKVRNKNIDLNLLRILVWMKWGIKKNSFTLNELKNEIWSLYGLTENNPRDTDTIRVIIQSLIDEQIIKYQESNGDGIQTYIYA